MLRCLNRQPLGQYIVNFQWEISGNNSMVCATHYVVVAILSFVIKTVHFIYSLSQIQNRSLHKAKNLVCNTTLACPSSRRAGLIRRPGVHTQSNPGKEPICRCRPKPDILKNRVHRCRSLAHDTVVLVQGQRLLIYGVRRGCFDRGDQRLVEEDLQIQGNKIRR